MIMKRKSSAPRGRDGDDQPRAPAGGGAAHESGGGRDDGDAEASRAKIKRQPAALPWMRNPVALDAGTAVPLAHVRGLHAQLIHCLEAGAEHLFGLSAAARMLHHEVSDALNQSTSSTSLTGLRNLRHVPAAVRLIGMHEQLQRACWCASFWRRGLHGAVRRASRGVAADRGRLQRGARPLHLGADGVREDPGLRPAHRGRAAGVRRAGPMRRAHHIMLLRSNIASCSTDEIRITGWASLHVRVFHCYRTLYC